MSFPRITLIVATFLLTVTVARTGVAQQLQLNPSKFLPKQMGCNICCPECKHICQLDISEGEVDKTCFEVESEVICIPRVVFPWDKRKAVEICDSDCDACGGKGCGIKIPTLKCTSCLRINCRLCLKKEAACDSCDSCDDCGGCDCEPCDGRTCHLKIGKLRPKGGKFAWPQLGIKRLSRSCEACDDRGCSACVHNGAKTRIVRVLKSETYKCPECKYTWSATERICEPACDGCDSCCDLGCDSDTVSEPTSNLQVSQTQDRLGTAVEEIAQAPSDATGASIDRYLESVSWDTVLNSPHRESQAKLEPGRPGMNRLPSVIR